MGGETTMWAECVDATIFDARMSAVQLAGLATCLGGALAFSLLGQRSQSTAKRD